MLWDVALMLGLIAREPERVRDPLAPAGVTTIPNDPVITALLPSYAKALLYTDCDCSARFGCACAQVEQRLNNPPPDHPHPTAIIPALSGEASSAISCQAAAERAGPDAHPDHATTDQGDLEEEES